MIQSMTGYGRTVVELPGKNVIIEINSLNSKQLDINSRIIATYRDKELDVRSYVSSQLARGKIDVTISLEAKEDVTERKIHTALAKTYYKEISELASELHAENFSVMDAVLRLPDVWSTDSQSFVTDEEWEKVMGGVVSATKNMITYRLQEGEALNKDLRSNISAIKDLSASIEPFETARIEKIREKIESALAEFIASDKIDKNRLEQEMIFYIEKLDINEEKVRLAQHCKYFLDTMDEDPYAGKKLNFIAQEMGREINTMGSKSNDADMQRIVVQMKDYLEKIKEQVLNVL